MNLIKKNTKQTLNPRTHFHLYDKEDWFNKLLHGLYSLYIYLIITVWCDALRSEAPRCIAGWVELGVLQIY